MKTLHTPIAEISFNEIESILYINVQEGAEMNLENTQVHYKLINNLVGDKNYLALVDAFNYYTIEKEAWEYASLKEVVSNRKAIAHFNLSTSNRLTISFFKSTYNTSIPLEIFNTKDEALAWLRLFPL